LDEFRIKPEGMAQCNQCGFVSYPTKYKTYEEIKEYYRKSYRQAPNNSHLFSGERKLWYHERLLRPLIEEWKVNKIRPVIGEVGSAFGMFLKWMTEQIDCEVFGTEFTTSFRRVAFHEFGIKLDEELDLTRKYDLLASYHVLEHQLDADKWLEKYLNALSPSGVMYLSTPIWFRELTNFGSQGFDLGYYWHPDHINAWSEKHLEHLIAKAGGEIIFKNDDIYGNSYILKKAAGGPATLDTKWDPNKSREDVQKIQMCWKLIQENKTAAAIEIWPNCITAWINHFELNRSKFDKDRPEMNRFLNQMVAACPNTSDALTMAADVSSRYEDYDGAFELFKKALLKKPNSPTMLMGMANCRRQQALRLNNDPAKKAELLRESLEITRRLRDSSIEMSNQAVTWIYHDQALIPLEGE